jgi:DNA-binding NarL/FixJ family response regulator
MTIKLLVVDDHEIIRFGLCSFLDALQGLEVVGEAGDGVTAVSESVKCVPDVVLMDLRMPKMDGIEATKAIKDKLKNIRVLMLTSNDSQEDILAALTAGADGYLLKDSSGKQLLSATEAVHAGATWLDPKVARYILMSINSPQAAHIIQESGKSSAFGLTERELEVVRLLVEGLSNSEIANRLVISNETMKTHMIHIMEKLRVSDRAQVAVKDMRNGLF